MFSPSPASTLPAGHGAIRMSTIAPPARPAEESRRAGQQISFPVLRFSYPLKLIVSRTYRNDLCNLQVGLVYLLNYGGGLVSGDQLSLEIELDEKCHLLCLSQGSTKDEIRIDKLAILCTVPEQRCFRDSSFVQKQIYHLQDHTSSLICLDWFTSGRSLSTRLQDQPSQLESWTFKKFQSFVEVYISSSRLVRENLILQKDQHHLTPGEFTLYANLYLVCSSDHPQLSKTLDRLKQLDQTSNKTRRQHPGKMAGDQQADDQPQLLWCFAELSHPPGPGTSPPPGDRPPNDPPPPKLHPRSPGTSVRIAIVRIGSHSSILVRDWLEENLADLQELIGPGFYKNCF